MKLSAFWNEIYPQVVHFPQQMLKYELWKLWAIEWHQIVYDY